MGKRARLKQERLAEKLRQVRDALGLSQTEMWRRLGAEELIDYKRISEYELDKNEPPLEILLRYARAAGVHMEVLVDDELDLPDQLPGPVKHDAIKRAFASRTRTRSKKH